MCGVIGYVGKLPALPILLGGLRRLEYRGYDSAGIGLLRHGALEIHRSVGEVSALEAKLVPVDVSPSMGIGHVRWATHGEVSEKNAHPHMDEAGRIAVVHNGSIENEVEIRSWLLGRGHRFRSETDTELLAHLVSYEMRDGQAKNLVAAVKAALARVRGTYALIVMSAEAPDQLVAARLGSDLLVASDEQGAFVTSESAAILSHTRRVTELKDGELAILSKEGSFQILSTDLQAVNREAATIEWSLEEAQRGGHPHFMLKEILEQPEAVRNTLRGRLRTERGEAVLGGLREHEARLREVKRLFIIGCGSAYHAGLVGKVHLERYAGLPVEVALASEIKYAPTFYDEGCAVLSISQSGITMDTALAQREAKAHGALALGIVNVVGSTIARESDAGVYNHAGPEIGVASTKAFVSQLTVLALLTVFLGRQRRLSMAEGIEIMQALEALPSLVAHVLECRPQIQEIARQIASAKSALFLGRGANAAIAYEAALKLKEVAYIHAEGYAAGEMKHGPLALVEAGYPAFFLCPPDALHDKTRGNMREIASRGGHVYAVTTDGNHALDELCQAVIRVPSSHPLLFPLLSVIPFQLLAYEVAVARGLNPDKPRNLAKAVTVE